MKTAIRIILVIVAVGGIMISGCRKEGPPIVAWGTDAVVVGWNYGACPICGGFYMNFGNKKQKDSTTQYVYHWSTSVSAFFLKENYKVPLFVRETYHQDTFTRPASIFVDSIALR